MKYNLVLGRRKDIGSLERIVYREYKPKQRRVCFTGFIQSNIQDIVVLARYYYKKDDYKILILSDWNCEPLYKRIKSIGFDLFDEVILIRERGKKSGNTRFVKINHQLNQIDFSSIDIIHLSAFNQNSFIMLLVNHLAPHTKLIQNQFTGTSYYVKEYYTGLSNIFNKHKGVILKLKDRINELWVHDRDIVVGDTKGIKVVNFNIKRILSNKRKLKRICKDLNKLFAYSHKPTKNRIVFLEQPLYSLFNNSEINEIDVFNKLFGVLNEHNIIVKTHPRCDNSKYRDIDVDLFYNPKVPWELILYNELLIDNVEDKIFITYYSDSLDNTHYILSVLDIKHYSIRVVNILNKIIGKEIGTKWFNKYYLRFKQKYSKDIYDVDSMEELRDLLSNI